MFTNGFKRSHDTTLKSGRVNKMDALCNLTLPSNLLEKKAKTIMNRKKEICQEQEDL